MKTIAERLLHGPPPQRACASEGEKTTESPRHRKMIVAEFYYSFRGGYTETSHVLMLRSLIYQVWTQEPRLWPLLGPIYMQRCKSCELNNTEPLWSFDTLESIMRSLCNCQIPLNICLIVDAMDESRADMQDDVLRLFVEMARSEANCALKIMVASRPQAIHKYVGQGHRFVLQRFNRQDIEKMVNKTINSFHAEFPRETTGTVAFRQDLTARVDYSTIQDYILSNADGVFLWVTLVLQNVASAIAKGGYSIADLEQRVRKLPLELGGPNGFYRAMVDSIAHGQARGREDLDHDVDGDDETAWSVDYARKILTWVTFAERVLYPDHLAEALAISQLTATDYQSDWDLERHRPQQIERGVMTYCAGLIEIKPQVGAPYLPRALP